jgi:hypothetical protein
MGLFCFYRVLGVPLSKRESVGLSTSIFSKQKRIFVAIPNAGIIIGSYSSPLITINKFMKRRVSYDGKR